MPTLLRIKKKRENDSKRRERMRVYNDQHWRDLRSAKLMEYPLCEVCEARGIIELATDIHHMDSFMRYRGLKQMEKAFDSFNLVSLCKRCHSYIHTHTVADGMTVQGIAGRLDMELGKGISPKF